MIFLKQTITVGLNYAAGKDVERKQNIVQCLFIRKDCRGHMIVEFTTTCAINAYHH
jgi:hypothetical protein